MLKNDSLRFSQLWVAINSLLAVVLSFVSVSIVPEQFLRDSSYFDQILSSSISGFSGPVSLIGGIYSFIGVHTPGVTLRLVSTAIFITNVHLFFRYFELQVNKRSQYFLISLCFLLIPFYGSGYSKELLVAIANILLMCLLYRVKQIQFLYFPLISILIAMTLRPYYLMTLLFFFFVYFILTYVPSVVVRITCIVFVLSGIITAEYHTKLILTYTGFNILTVRTNSQSVLKIAARSQIEQVEPTGNFLSNLIAILQVIKSMIFPYDSVSLSPYLLAAFGMNVVVWGIVIMSLRMAVSRNNSTMLTIASFILAFVMTATFFEVDAGSFIRHFYPFLPLGVLILQSTSRKQKLIGITHSSQGRFH